MFLREFCLICLRKTPSLSFSITLLYFPRSETLTAYNLLQISVTPFHALNAWQLYYDVGYVQDVIKIQKQCQQLFSIIKYHLQLT